MLNCVRKIGKNTSQIINNYGPGRHVQEQVMTTAQWPVPYYNRKFKAYPVKGCLNRTKTGHVQTHR